MKSSATQKHVFISYRRADSADIVGRIRATLSSTFGEDVLFTDVRDIESGVKFLPVIRKALARCEIVLVVVGPDWTGKDTEGSGHSRIVSEHDHVRLEIRTALENDSKIIPIMVNDAEIRRAWPPLAIPSTSP